MLSPTDELLVRSVRPFLLTWAGRSCVSTTGINNILNCWTSEFPAAKALLRRRSLPSDLLLYSDAELYSLDAVKLLMFRAGAIEGSFDWDVVVACLLQAPSSGVPAADNATDVPAGCGGVPAADNAIVEATVVDLPLVAAVDDNHDEYMQMHRDELTQLVKQQAGKLKNNASELNKLRKKNQKFLCQINRLKRKRAEQDCWRQKFRKL